MALDIPPGQAVSFALAGTRAARQLSRASALSLDEARGRGLGDGTTVGRFVERTVTINTANAAQGLRQSTYAGTAIRGALRELAGLAKLARNDGLVSNETYLLSRDGTRVSRGNIQAQIKRAIGLIDKLVAATAVGSANFIDGSGPAIRVQTSRYGGNVAILPQGLDSASLGLRNLDVSSGAEARFSQARLENAIATAGIRLNRLTQLQAALGQINAFDQSFIAATADISGALPVGAFVNLSA